ncbi:uncharacterized protein BO87DRAFT_8148 [Aspergillus neoniger CBS 115656]|uniref:Uncharacterized protein n=1 Tax=Aspergillus neoniger (strain CBS 115656) TaxID=1448310 RepID=A0A318YY36_ASPNB|nr:hypothetical protein BO87DRAFT_8148 [Aspergillus neoniger CBS 115656]PYH39865.1 hypothetical protein BO87DRAFT_8148 [Aspergillus neoniger CBS 115656]
MTKPRRPCSSRNTRSGSVLKIAYQPSFPDRLLLVQSLATASDSCLFCLITLPKVFSIQLVLLGVCGLILPPLSYCSSTVGESGIPMQLFPLRVKRGIAELAFLRPCKASTDNDNST